MYRIPFLFFVILSFLSCQDTKLNAQTYQPTMEKDETYWKNNLSNEAYYVLREKGTERPYSGTYNNFFEKGTYHCAGCDQKLFESDTKFDAHCGWPSFDKAIKGAVSYIEDRSHGMIRTEVICSNCKGHLGHVFNDGPRETTGERYCMNSVSLKFVKDE